jgi:hypothetical protein
MKYPLTAIWSTYSPQTAITVLQTQHERRFTKPTNPMRKKKCNKTRCTKRKECNKLDAYQDVSFECSDNDAALPSSRSTSTSQELSLLQTKPNAAGTAHEVSKRARLWS